MTTTQIKRLILEHLNIIANSTDKIHQLNNMLEDEEYKGPNLNITSEFTIEHDDLQS